MWIYSPLTLSLDNRGMRVLLILALTLLFTASVESALVQRIVVEDKFVPTKKERVTELPQVGNKASEGSTLHEPLLGDAQRKVSLSGSVVHSESASLDEFAGGDTDTDPVAATIATEEKQNVLLAPKVPIGIVPDGSAEERTIVKGEPEVGSSEATTSSGQLNEPLTGPLTPSEPVLENSATIGEHTPNTSTRANEFNHDASVFANELETANSAVVEASRDVNLTGGNLQDAEAPSGGIASQSEADEQEEQPARDPENVHAISPPQKVKSDAATIHVVVHEPNRAPDVASEVFASYVAERLRRERMAAAKVAGVHSIERDDQIDTGAMAREAAVRRRAFARDPDKAWRNAPPQHLYTGYTYRPPHSWSGNVTASPADATTVSAKSDVYEEEETDKKLKDNHIKSKAIEEPEKKVILLGLGLNEGVNVERTENEVAIKRMQSKSGSEGFRDASTKEHFQMTKRGGATASKALITVVGVGILIGAFRLCLATDRRSLLLLRRCGQPKEHV